MHISKNFSFFIKIDNDIVEKLSSNRKIYNNTYIPSRFLLWPSASLVFIEALPYQWDLLIFHFWYFWYVVKTCNYVASTINLVKNLVLTYTDRTRPIKILSYRYYSSVVKSAVHCIWQTCYKQVRWWWRFFTKGLTDQQAHISKLVVKLVDYIFTYK